MDENFKLTADIQDAYEELMLEGAIMEEMQRKAFEALQEEKIVAALSEIKGKPIDDNTLVSQAEYDLAVDRSENREHALVRPSLVCGKYPILTGNDRGDVFEVFNACSAKATEIIQEYTPENTKRAYKGDLAYWRAWLFAIGHNFNQQISKEHIIAFIIQHSEEMPREIDERLVQEKYKKAKGTQKLSTIKRRIASLSVYIQINRWPNPCRDKDVAILLQKLATKHGSSKASGKAITKDILDDLLATCNEDKLIDIRDKAVLLFAWSSGGRRRSEVVDAVMENLTETAEGNYIYLVERSKTDQEGRGQPVPIVSRAANALRAWLQASSVKEGAIFRAISKSQKVGSKLSAIDVNRIVKRRAKLAGYDEKQFGAHSLRSGFVTEGGLQNKNLGDIMALTGHRSVAIAMRYYQSGNVINNAASGMAG